MIDVESRAVATSSRNWHDRRDGLECGMVFRILSGDVVRLDQHVVGDGTRWLVDRWHGNHWSHDGETIEPGDLVGCPISDLPTE